MGMLPAKCVYKACSVRVGRGMAKKSGGPKRKEKYYTPSSSEIGSLTKEMEHDPEEQLK
jgi:hypothetical protein